MQGIVIIQTQGPPLDICVSKKQNILYTCVYMKQSLKKLKQTIISNMPSPFERGLNMIMFTTAPRFKNSDPLGLYLFLAAFCHWRP